MAHARLGKSHVLPLTADVSSGDAKRDAAAPTRPADLVDVSPAIPTRAVTPASFVWPGSCATNGGASAIPV